MAEYFIHFFKQVTISDAMLRCLSENLANCPSQGLLAIKFFISPKEQLGVCVNGGNAEIKIVIEVNKPTIFEVKADDENYLSSTCINAPASIVLGQQPIDYHFKASFSLDLNKTFVTPRGKKACEIKATNIDPSSYIKPSPGKSFNPDPMLLRIWNKNNS